MRILTQEEFDTLLHKCAPHIKGPVMVGYSFAYHVKVLINPDPFTTKSISFESPDEFYISLSIHERDSNRVDTVFGNSFVQDYESKPKGCSESALL